MQTNTVIGVAVVGYGYWSPKLIRNIDNNEKLNLRVICEKDVSRHPEIKKNHQDAEVCQHYRDAFTRDDIDAVIIATIPSSHYRIAKLALENGKHVLVEKPLTLTVDEGEVLLEIAARKKLVLMVDHTFLYSPAILKLANLVQEGELGTLYSIESTRANLGLFQRDTNVLWDLAPHDIAITLFLLNKLPTQVRAIGKTTVVHPKQSRAQESDCHLILRYEDGPLVHIFVSWTSPEKIRRYTLVGSERMATYDLMSGEPLKLFDQGIYPVEGEGDSGPLFTYKLGATSAIPLEDQGEDLARMIEDFSVSVASGTIPRSNGQFALNVVKVLAAAQRSLDNDGKPISMTALSSNPLRKLAHKVRPR